MMPRVIGAAVLAFFAAGCEPFVGSSLHFDLPKIGTTLAGPNFEYVKKGVVGDAAIGEHADSMIQSYEIGVVNEALREILGQAPPNEPVALVNVVVEITKRTTTITVDNWFSQTVTTVENDQFLVIRADIVRFTGPLPPGPNVVRPPEPASAAASDVDDFAARLAALRRSGDRDGYRELLVALALRMAGDPG